jgi:mono/diheme cytochrome c family protein
MRLIPLIYIILPVILAGCSGDGVGLGTSGDVESGQTGAVSFSGEIQPLFNDRCTQCHIPGGSGYVATGGDSGGLDLTGGAAYQSLVGVRTFQKPQEAPRWRVLAGEPDSSYLYQKIVSDSPKESSRMPLGGPFLDDSEIELIERWIEEGAADN